MIPSVKKLLALGFLLFVALWAAGVVWTFTLSEPEPELTVPVISNVSGSYENARAGARVANNLAQIGLVQAPLPQVLDQEDINKLMIYEKTAQLSEGTTAFPDDEAKVRQAVETHKASVFSESSTGIAPRRSLTLGIAVPPQQFDPLLTELSRVGQLASINVQQQDRTTEFRRLHAQRQSLKKHLEAILKLRDAGKLTVEEALKLEQKVLEVEKEVQGVGVQLGDLLNREPSYNLFLTLQEYRPGSWDDRSFTFTRRVGSGFVRAVGWWLVVAAGACLFLGTYASVRTLWPARPV